MINTDKVNIRNSPVGDDWDDVRSTLFTVDEMTNTDLKVKLLEVSQKDS